MTGLAGSCAARSFAAWPDDRDLDEEIRFHLAQETERRIAGGMSRAEAERAARMTLGSPALVKERTRAVWVWTALEQLVQDLAIRIPHPDEVARRSAPPPILLVALVIGGNATIFSMAHGILAKPSPGVHATGLMTVSWVAEDGFIETHNGYRVFTHFSEHTSAFASITAYDFRRATVMHENGSYAVRAGIVSPNYFETLGVRIVNGRSFTADEATRGTSGLVAVISHQLWQTDVSRHGRDCRPRDHAERQPGHGGWRGRARVSWRDHGGARGSVAAACRRAPRASRSGSRNGGGDDRPPRAGPFARRSASRACNPVGSTAVRSGGHAKIQGSARAVLGDGRRQQPRLDVRLSDPGDLLDRHAADRADRLRQRGEPADRARRRPAARDRAAAVARRVASSVSSGV